MMVVDVEATGLDPSQHSIISIGALDFSNPTNTFYIECRPFEGASATDEALAVNGADWLNNSEKPSLCEAMHKFLDWSSTVDGNRELAGSNISFDKSFLSSTATRCGIIWDPGHHSVDVADWFVMSLYMNKIPIPDKFRTDDILTYVGLGPEPRPHIAITGAKMEAEAFARLLGRGLLEEFKGSPIPDYLLKMDNISQMLKSSNQTLLSPTAQNNQNQEPLS